MADFDFPVEFTCMFMGEIQREYLYNINTVSWKCVDIC